MKRRFNTTKLLCLLLFSLGACYYYLVANKYQLPGDLSLSIPQNLPLSIPYRAKKPSSNGDPFEVSGDNRAEIWTKAETRPRVGKVHALFGEGRTQANERSIEHHLRHSLAMDHPMFVLREEILKNVWTKHALMQSIITQELMKPADQRLEWLMWVDADVVVMNPTISLNIFIPPSPEFDHINILATNDYGRLNDGVFMVRINEGTLRFFAMVIGFPSFKPEVKLKYSEQSSMEKPEWRESALLVPQNWFNAYRLHNGTVGHTERLFEPGMLQIHFAGNRDGLRPDRMNNFMDIADQNLPEYNVAFEDSFYQHNISEFWSNFKNSKSTVKVKDGGKKKPAMNEETATKQAQSPVVQADFATKSTKPTGNPTVEHIKDSKMEAANLLKNQTQKVVEEVNKKKEGKGWRGKEFGDLPERKKISESAATHG